MDQALNSQKTPTSPLRASYGMSFVSILMKNDRVIKGFYCIYIQNESMDLVDNDEIYYSITVTTTPGEGLFEATMKYNTVFRNFTAPQQDISRINAYDDQSRCVLEINPSLLRFCYC